MNDDVVNGNSTMTPTVSPTSASTWTMQPSATPTLTARLRFHAQSTAATSKPKNTVWVMPIPGQPRCQRSGTVAP